MLKALTDLVSSNRVLQPLNVSALLSRSRSPSLYFVTLMEDYRLA